MIMGETVLDRLAALKWPLNAFEIKQLTLAEKEIWYFCQDSRHMIFLAQRPDFKKFWYWTYLFPLRVKRFFWKLSGILRGH